MFSEFLCYKRGEYVDVMYGILVGRIEIERQA